jgi:hypothetical protein
MSEKLDKVLKDSNKSLDKITASSGCDLITGVDAFTARKGKIWAIIVAEDATEITSFVEGIKGTETTITTRSYIGVSLGKDVLIIFDAPVSTITLASGSVWAYYFAV